jgi:hypothetical protein
MGNSVKPYGHTIPYKFGNIIFLKESENLFSPLLISPQSRPTLEKISPQGA